MEDIKFAKPEDFTQIVAFCYKAFEENQLEGSKCSIDFDKIVLEVTDNLTNHVVLVKRNTEDPRSIDGLIMLKVGSVWWSNDLILNNILFYTKPEVRSFKLAKDLLKAAQKYAIMNRLPFVFDIFDQKDATKKKNLLKYLGFKDYGSSYIFNT